MLLSEMLQVELLRSERFSIETLPSEASLSKLQSVSHVGSLQSYDCVDRTKRQKSSEVAVWRM